MSPYDVNLTNLSKKLKLNVYNWKRNVNKTCRKAIESDHQTSACLQ